MTFTPEQIAALQAPLNSANVKQRSQAGRSLSYIEGWKAIDEANRIFGYDKWLRLTEEIKPVCEPYQDPTGKWRVGYMARVRIVVETNGGELMRDGCGFGSGIDKDLGQAHESALKEAETDAMKRALMTFGNPFGLALYDKEQRNVADEPAPERLPREANASDRTTASTLISALRMAKTEVELKVWGQQNLTTIESLPVTLKDEVRLAFAEHLDTLRRQKAA